MIHNALKLVRKFHNVKQKDLADKLGLSPSYLSEIESGRKAVTIEILQKYSDHFSIPASSLLYFAENTGKNKTQIEENPIAMKALKMLDWLDTITGTGQEDD